MKPIHIYNLKQNAQLTVYQDTFQSRAQYRLSPKYNC